MEFIIGGEVVEFFVEKESFADAGDVAVGEEDFEVGFDDALFDVLPVFFDFLLEEVVEFGFFEFVDGFVEDFMVHVVADVADEAALFGTEDIAGSPDVEVAHGDVEAAADAAEFFDGFEAFLSVVGEAAVGGDEHVAEGFFVAATYATAHLVEVAESEVLGIVDDHGVGVGDVQPVLNDGGGDKDIDFAFEEAHHGVLDYFSVHLAMGHGYVGVGDKAVDETGHFGKVFDPVADEERLSAARHFEADGVANDLFVEVAYFGLDGLPVGRGGADDAEVAGSHE